MNANRLGKLVVSYDLCKDHEAMIKIQKDIAVLRTEENHALGVLTMICTGSCFDHVNDGEAIPRYNATIDDLSNIKFERIVQ